MITGDSVHRSPLICAKRKTPFWHTWDHAGCHSALTGFVNERRNTYFPYIQLRVFLARSVLSLLSYFGTGENDGSSPAPNFPLQTRSKCCVKQQMVIEESRGRESWSWGTRCRDRYMLPVTLTSFSRELGLVSTFCLNKVIDTVSDFSPPTPLPVCVLAFPLSVAFFLGGRSGIVY